MEEQIIIEHLDELINDFVKSDNDVFTTMDFLSENQKHLSKRKDRAETCTLADEIENFGLKKTYLNRTRDIYYH